MKGRNERLNPQFNRKHVQPLKPHKAAQAPNIMNRTNTAKNGVNPKLKPLKGPCPKGGEVCHCHPKTIVKH
jgi:hypothetical protein